MHLLSCENPQRVYNKYTNDYVWVPCGSCNMCKNRKSAHYTELLERERSQHSFCFFVTLTYSNENIPLIEVADFVQRDGLPEMFVSNRSRDNLCISFSDFFPKDLYNIDYDEYDLNYFVSLFKDSDNNPFVGLPYASKTDAQLFLKRLNKYIHDHVSSQFKNFRYFLVSEYGSTTFRPHFHIIFYVDLSELADKFSDCVSACWKFGRVDTQSVKSSACAYVAQYVNKFSDLPYVYKNRQIRPFILCSRNPFIGTFSNCPEDDAEIINSATPTTFAFKRQTPNLDVVPLEFSRQNRLFPKCPSYGSVNDYLRIELYTITSRFSSRTFKGFLNQIYDYLSNDTAYRFTEFYQFLIHKLSFSIPKDVVFHFDHRHPWQLFDEYSYNWLRRLYYCSKKVSRQACQFGFSIKYYISKIIEYYSNKEKYLINKMYEFQQSLEIVDSSGIDFAIMYPEYLYNRGIYVREFIDTFQPREVLLTISNAAYYAFSNKKTHFKNAYLDSLSLKKDSLFLFNLIKDFIYGKKCDEIAQALAT